jgi:microcin C transport system substrate-binding protein
VNKVFILCLSFFIFFGCDSAPKKNKKGITDLSIIQAVQKKLDAQEKKMIQNEMKNLNWKTNNTDPIYADQNAKKGGVYRTWMTSYPLTFRLYGPNSNSGKFVSYNRAYAFFNLTSIHPNTRSIIPQLAKKWAVLPDNKTVYYKLDPDARWSDGKPITADDYVFYFYFTQSNYIKAPYYKQYARDHFQKIEKIDKYTIRIVAKKPSWRILYETNINPLPFHATVLNKDWVKNHQWFKNVVPGPYALKKFTKGKYVEFHRIKNWWGKEKRWFKGMYNFDKIRLNVVSDENIAFELFKKGKFDLFTPNETQWMKKSNIKETKNGYIQKQMFRIQRTYGQQGIFLNAKNPVWSDVRLRKALAHLFDFDTINKKYLYSLFSRMDNFFETYPPYKNQNIKALPFDLKKANELLDLAGWSGKRNKEGLREKNGKSLSITILIGSPYWTRFLTFYKNVALKAGINILIKQMDGAAFFKAIHQKTYQAVVLSFGSGSFPSPRQLLHSENVKVGTNNIFQFGTKKIDQLIDIYQFNLDETKRVKAIFQIEEIVRENAIMVLFWKSNYQRILRWRYLKGPKTFVTKQGFDYDLLWYEQEEGNKLKVAQKDGTSFPPVQTVRDPFGLDR